MDVKRRAGRLLGSMSLMILVWISGGRKSVEAVDWPMWGRDALRSRYSPQPLPEALTLQWVLDLTEPRPAWGDDTERLRFDHHYEPILLEGRLYLPSMVSDRLTCHDANTGAELWRFYADGPIRLAAAGREGRVFFSCDDGHLYCLNAETGALEWRFRGGPADRRLLGNGRLVSSWAARGGPVVRDGIVYFAASIWPLMGVFIHAVDARSGERIWTNSGSGSRFTVQQHQSPAFAGIAPQGYLVATEEHLVVSGGRTVPAVLRRSDGTLLNFNLSSRRMGTKGGGGYGVLAGDDFFLVGGGLYQLNDGRFIGPADAVVFAEGSLIGKDADGLCAFEPRAEEVERTNRWGRKTKRIVVPKRWSLPVGVDVEEVFIRCGDRIYCRGRGTTVLSVDISEAESGASRDSEGSAESGEPTGAPGGEPKEPADPEEPNQPKEQKAMPGWTVELPDEARSMIAGDGKLIVSTDAGRIYCFGEGKSTVRIPAPRSTCLVGKGATWRFRDSGKSPGADWPTRSFDDQKWKSGPAPLGYGDDRVATELSYGSDPDQKPVTCFFRHDFEVGPDLRVASLELRALIDDGAAFYLNGREVGRLFLPRGELRPDTLASQGTDSRTYYRLQVSAGDLLAGSNTLAVEVRQRERTSSDLLFDLELLALPPAPTPRWDEADDLWTVRAKEILEASGARDGYCLAIGLGSGRLVSELARQSSLHVVVVDPDGKKVDAFRRRMDAIGAYGTRVAVVVASFGEVELPAYFAELVVAEEPAAVGMERGRPFVDRVFHCLRPSSGVALFAAEPQARERFVAAAAAAKLDRGAWSQQGGYAMLRRVGPPTGSADWTHQHADAANSVVSRDAVVKAPFQVLWYGGPSNADVLPRHGHGPVPHVVGGRLFIEGRDMLRATDIYTGRLLWQRELPGVGKYYDYTSHEPGANAIGSNFVSLPDGVYIIHRDRCLRLDPATGATRSAFTLPGAGEDAKTSSWAFLAARDRFLIAGGWPTDFDSPEFDGQSLIDLSGFWLRRGVSNIRQLKDFEALSYEEALALYPVDTGSSFRDEDDEVEDQDASDGAGSAWQRRFRSSLISDSEWQAHAEAEHRSYLLANLNKLLLEEDMLAKIPERVSFGRTRGGEGRGTNSRRRWPTVKEIGEKLVGYLRQPGAQPNDRKALELKRDVLNRRYRFPAYRENAPGKFGATMRTGSRLLYALDRHTGDVRWKVRARHQFRHGAIAVGRDAVYAIDRMTSREASYYRRRGTPVDEGAGIVALDLRTGTIRWRDTEHVFGTWLGYSVEHDILIQAGAHGPDRLRDEARAGIVAHRGSTGEVVWKTNRSYSGPCLLLGRRVITQGYSAPGFALDLFTGERIRIPHPLSGVPVDWGYTRKYGCNTAVGSPNLLTFRSAAAGYYDLLSDCGTSNLGGIRSGCTSNLLPAGGILNAPDYTRTCTCSYQNQVSAAFIHAPDAPRWSFSPHTPDLSAVEKLGLNFGAPGDRMGPDGTLWLDLPSVGGESPDLPVEFLPQGEAFEFPLQDESWIEGGQLRWVGASGMKGGGEVVVHLLPPGEVVIENEVRGRSALHATGAVLSSTVPPIFQREEKGRVSLGGGFSPSRRFKARIAGYAELAAESVAIELWVRADGDPVFVEAGSARRKRQGFVITSMKPKVRYFVVANPEAEAEPDSGGADDGEAGGRQAGDDGDDAPVRRSVTIESEEEIPRDRWTHLAFAYDACLGQGSLYLNGKLVGREKGAPGEPLWWDDPAPGLVVGELAKGTARFGELRVADRALAPREFLIGGSEFEPEPPVGHWRMSTAPHTPPDAKPYTVRLVFSELEELGPGDRTFHVELQGEPVLEHFDIAASAKGARRALVREYVGVQLKDTLRLKLVGATGAPLLSGIQLLAE